MKTIKAILAYDFRRYALVSIVIIPASMLLVPIPILFPLATTPFPMAGFLFFAIGWVGLGVPLLCLSTAMEIGQSASPLIFRRLIHTLPVDRERVALAKLLYALFWLVLLPLILEWTSVTIANGHIGHNAWYDLKDSAPRVATVALILASLIAWVMLVSALLPRGFAYISIPVFFVGEALSRDAPNFKEGLLLMAKDQWTLACLREIAFLSAELALLSSIFILYYKKRNRKGCLIGGVLALAGIDGVRFLVAWLMNSHG